LHLNVLGPAWLRWTLAQFSDAPMPDEGVKLCDACHKRQATCHINEITGGVIRSTEFCAECFEVREPAEDKQLRRASQTAPCKYCGGTPCVEWNSLTNIFGVVVTDGAPIGFFCASCTEEYNRFLAHEMERVPQGLSEAEESAIAGRLRKSGDEHMLEWLAKRRL
jgi:hypothetical protein